VESGQVGEIAVKSPYFSGYWRQPELTRASFIAVSPDRTIYRTGDLGYMRPGNCLVHLGRNDRQAKIRGHRVELGQVERLLLEHPAVSEAAVVVRGEPPGESRLVAYVVERAKASLASATLRSFLEARLPQYMVPAIIMQLDSLPTTPGGKLDRGNLPEPTLENLAIDSQYGEPRNVVETKLAKIWSEMLEIPRVGIHDRFLDLGGHSLLAGMIIARIAASLQFEIGFRDFFEHPTIALLAEFLIPNLPREFGDERTGNQLADVESTSSNGAPEAIKKDRE
jgi:hypothetical protein